MKFRYCPNCGANLKKEQPNKIYCLGCKFVHFLSPPPSTSVILEDDQGRVLLVRRKVDPGKGKWDLPGGFVNPKETLYECTRRELQEEIGVSIKDLTYYTSMYDRYVYCGIVEYPIIVFYVGKVSSPVKVGDDAVSAQFFPKNKIPYSRLAFSAVKQVLKQYTGNKRFG